MKFLNIIKICIVLLLVSSYSIFAGTTGKISGTVVDKDTKEALIGANVFIKNTNLGAATDTEGRYTILQVPPGKYE